MTLNIGPIKSLMTHDVRPPPLPGQQCSNCHIVLGVSPAPACYDPTLIEECDSREGWPPPHWSPGHHAGLWLADSLPSAHTNMTHSGARVTVIGRGHTGKNILLFFKLAGARFLKYFICYSTLKYLICYASSFSNFACCEREVCGQAGWSKQLIFDRQ